MDNSANNGVTGCSESQRLMVSRGNFHGWRPGIQVAVVAGKNGCPPLCLVNKRPPGRKDADHFLGNPWYVPHRCRHPYKVVPPSYKLVYNPMKTIDISPIKTIVIGVMFTNLAIERGHHLVKDLTKMIKMPSLLALRS